MSENLNVVDEMDNEILHITGGKPKEYNLIELFNQSQTNQRKLYGGGEENALEREWIESIKARETEIEERRARLIEEVDEVEEVDGLGRDGIIIRRL